MKVATFGSRSTSSPCSAQFIKNLNATDFAEQFSAATVAIVQNDYVDDYSDSEDTIEEAMKRAKKGTIRPLQRWFLAPQLNLEL